MQKNGRHKSAQNKGFYIILTVCALVIAISGYVLFFAPIQNSASMDSVEYVPDFEEPTWQPQKPDISQPVSKDVIEDEKITVHEQTQPQLEPVISEDKQETVQIEQPKSDTTEQKEKKSTSNVWIRPVDGEVSKSFSGEKLVYSEIFGDWRVHSGTDYAVDEGERVYSVRNGEIVDIKKDALWNSCVTIKLSDGTVAVYRGLNDDLKVKVGSKVSAGDVIGTVSKVIPAEADQPTHVHFELIDKDGRTINAEEQR